VDPMLRRAGRLCWRPSLVGVGLSPPLQAEQPPAGQMAGWLRLLSRGCGSCFGRGWLALVRPAPSLLLGLSCCFRCGHTARPLHLPHPCSEALDIKAGGDGTNQPMSVCKDMENCSNRGWVGAGMGLRGCRGCAGLAAWLLPLPLRCAA